MTVGIINLSLNDDAPELAVTDAGTVECERVTDLDGMREVDVQFKFLYGGTGGQKVQAYLQTSLDQGTTWLDLYCFSATTASKTRALRIKPDGVVMTPTDGALADDTLQTGIVLGDRLRVKVVTTAATPYAGGAQLSIRGAVR